MSGGEAMGSVRVVGDELDVVTVFAEDADASRRVSREGQQDDVARTGERAAVGKVALGAASEIKWRRIAAAGTVSHRWTRRCRSAAHRQRPT
jgi:hypothetical protein